MAFYIFYIQYSLKGSVQRVSSSVRWDGNYEMLMDSNPGVTGPPDPGTRPRLQRRCDCSPHLASNIWGSVSWDHHMCDSEIPEYMSHPNDHGRWASAVQVH